MKKVKTRPTSAAQRQEMNQRPWIVAAASFLLNLIAIYFSFYKENLYSCFQLFKCPMLFIPQLATFVISTRGGLGRRKEHGVGVL